MKKQSIRYFTELNLDDNIKILQKALPEKSIIVEFNSNSYFKEFLSYFITVSNLELVKELVFKLVDIKNAESNSGDINDDFYDDSSFHSKASYFISSIIMYAKCFNSSKGKIKRVDVKKLLKALPEDLELDDKKLCDRFVTIHQKIINLRNKYIAHADESDFETAKAYISFNFNELVLEHSINGIYLGVYNLDSEEMQDWLLLISFIIKSFTEKQKELAKLFFESIDKEELLKLAGEAGAFNKSNG